MASIRARLTTAYAGALLASVVVFAVVVYFARSARADRELETEAMQRGDLAVLILRQALAATPTSRDTAPRPAFDLPGSLRLPQPATVTLDAIPGYLTVVDAAGSVLYESPAIVRLRTQTQGIDQPQRAEDVRRFNAAVDQLRTDTLPIHLDLSDDIVLVSRRDTDPAFRSMYVVAGVSRSESDSAQRELLPSPPRCRRRSRTTSLSATMAFRSKTAVHGR